MEIRLKLVSGTSGTSGSPVVFFWPTKVCIGVEWCRTVYPRRISRSVYTSVSIRLNILLSGILNKLSLYVLRL
jgi:hypothetical protein